METDGFPETGWGSWRQYQRRMKKRGPDAGVGVACRACINTGRVCRECEELSHNWAQQHYGNKGKWTAEGNEAMVAAR